MCYGTEIALAVGAAAAIAGAAVSAKAATSAGEAQKQEAEANEVLAQAEARDEFKRARFELYKKGIKVRRDIGTQEAIAAGANLDLTFGSASDILSDRFAMTARDSVAIMQNAYSRSTALRNSAAVYRARGNNAVSVGRTQAAGAAIAGAGRLANTGFTYSTLN